jgi:hypothetical protein
MKLRVSVKGWWWWEMADGYFFGVFADYDGFIKFLNWS